MFIYIRAISARTSLGSINIQQKKRKLQLREIHKFTNENYVLRAPVAAIQTVSAWWACVERAISIFATLHARTERMVVTNKRIDEIAAA